jgi:uncharacterized protein (TIGR00251 family)
MLSKSPGLEAVSLNTAIKIRVTPRSSKNDVRIEGDSIKVWVNASPTDGQANEAVISLVAKRLCIAKSRVTLVSGHASRDKTLSIEGLSSQEIFGLL